MNIIWSTAARRDVARIVAYVAEFDTSAARRLARRLEEAVLPLAEHPYLYPSGPTAGTRKMVVTARYAIIYEVKTYIYVLAVITLANAIPNLLLRRS